MEERFKPFLARYDFRIYPTETQKKLFAKTFEACMYVHNKLLAEAKAEYEAYKQSCKTPSDIEHKNLSLIPIDLINKLVLIKSLKENTWFREISNVALQQTVMQLGNLLRKFFRTGKDCPEFKKKLDHQSFTLTKIGFRFKEGKLYVAKSKEPLEVSYTRKLPSEPSSITISKTPSGEYFISFLCKYDPN
jgi:putative transposase